MRRGQITQLTLGGFQVFAERTTFPLAPITLVFGPNSAGKSAVLDALTVLRRYCGYFGSTEAASSGDLPSQRLTTLLERHWRVERDPTPTLAQDVHLGVRVRLERSVWADSQSRQHTIEDARRGSLARFEHVHEALAPWLAQGGDMDLELQLQVSAPAALPLGGTFKDLPPFASLAQNFNRARSRLYELPLSAKLSLANTPLLVLEEWCETSINTSHPAFAGRLDLEPLERLAANHPGQCTLVDGWFRHPGSLLADTGLSLFILQSALAEDDDEDPEVGESADACIDVADIFDAIWLPSVAAIHQALSSTEVHASRTTPSRRELTYFKDGVWPKAQDVDAGRMGLQLCGRPEYDLLAVGALRASLTNADELFNQKPSRPTQDSIALDLVNRLLGEHLFKETGYFISAEVHEVRPIGQPKPPDQDSGPALAFGYLVTLVLEDANGRRFAFDEVGSGLGYVLPVLVALASSELTLIQQPELHLHPALQAELADALISSIKGFDDQPNSAHASAGQRIIETHSEHLLLRMLRRIQQTAAGKQMPSTLGLRRDDLVVLYVNPSADGTSAIKHLRIAADGDFIDRWPRGFFEERWKELFDE